ncbi:MAG: hypothetical protein HY982_01295, partial [Candidatus Magasanikbacteria bacterium]|nr:hypothetical protein [Candidatus Magasanikbacteria bacterium]
MLVFFSRVLKFAWQNFWRNLGFSLITILILVATLVCFDLVLLVRGVTGAAVRAVEEKVDISVLFKTSAPPAKIEELKNSLSKMPAVSSLVFKNREEVLEEFKN